MANEITVNAISLELAERVREVQAEPDFQMNSGSDCAVDSGGIPQVKVAIGNVPVDYDLWEGLRNPAVAGIYPAGLPELWEFYAHRKKQKVDEAGRQMIFQVPRSFEYARQNFRRAVIISAMLPFSPVMLRDYMGQILEKKNRSSFLFASVYNRINRIFDKALTRLAISLVTDDSERVIIVMNNDNVKAVSAEVIPPSRQGISHGPAKGENYPQKSLAVLMGLGQFGVSRMVFRDELVNGRVERWAGPIRSIVIFDREPLVTDGKDGIIYPSPAWRRFLFQLFDFTSPDAAIEQYRFCGRVSRESQSCNHCAVCCPSGAQESSSPKSDGSYSAPVSRQTHRFWENHLQFDFGRCIDELGQNSSLFSEWSCGRCLAVCLDRGIRRKTAVQNFYAKMAELAR
jgi:hypothetical protein